MRPNPAYQEGADYHTDDKSDAQFTARAFCGFGRTENGEL